MGWQKALSTCLGLGFLTKMPGTVASFVAVLAAFVIPVNLFLLAATIITGAIASGAYAATLSAEDPPEVVIDEIAGMWVALYGHGPGYSSQPLAFSGSLISLNHFRSGTQKSCLEELE